MTIHKHLIFILLSFFIISSNAQEVLTFPTFVPEIAAKYTLDKAMRTPKDNSAIKLPFYDDFSRITIYPSPSRWVDNYVYINTDYAKHPPTIGVATFDAIDEQGKLYANAGTFPFNADKLTSRPLRLDSLFIGIPRPMRKSDSLYLSFYYQPEGRGLKPAKGDSLILEFHSPIEFDTLITALDTTIVPHWTHVWSTQGGVSVDSFAVSKYQYFRQVLIPILDSTRYYKNGFQFRFRNIASLANNFVPDWKSNCDQWNLDLVWLNTGRHKFDTIINDIAFAENAPSMLANYQAMPYQQYATNNFLNEMKDSLNISIANLEAIPKNMSYNYWMKQDSKPLDSIYGGGSYYISPYLQSGYSNYQPFARPPVKKFYPINLNYSTVFHTYHIITSDSDPLFHSNDTIIFSQVLSNYYAYDNGSAEAGYGLNGAAGACAIQFKLNKPDTLQGIQIYFNQVLGQGNVNNIDLIVLNDIRALPGHLVKSMTITPLYSEKINEFTTYWFEEPLIINTSNFPGLIFYVGWHQDFISNVNIGFDRYIDSWQKRFININGVWDTASNTINGSLMIRPIIGKKNPLSEPEQYVAQSFKISPNPAMNGTFTAELPHKWQAISNYVKVSISSITGSEIKNMSYTNPIIASELKPGIYIVTLINTITNERISSKLIVTK